MKDCTGPSANWCPNCGDCKCPLNKYNERTLEDFDCPLHSYKSSHAEEEIEIIMKSPIHKNEAYPILDCPILDIKSSLDQDPPKPGQFDCWQRLINRYNFENVFKTGLVRNLNCENLHELKKLMVERRTIGIERYQTVLQAFNGRKAIDDLLAEQLDSLAYSEQVAIETPELTNEMLNWQRITINSIHKLIDFKSKQEKKEI